jgi:hypothetical protein
MAATAIKTKKSKSSSFPGDTKPHPAMQTSASTASVAVSARIDQERLSDWDHAS